MAILLTLRTDSEECTTPLVDGQILAEPTSLADLPSLKVLQADPFNQGRALTAALGGDHLLEHLDGDPDRLLLLAADTAAAAVPWEFAALPDRRLLVCRYGFLRLVDGRTAGRQVPQSLASGGSALQFIALATDPLVDDRGQPRQGYRLALDNELRAIRRTLENSGVAVAGQRIPPTRRALRRALRRGPTLLHLTCHGDVVETEAAGPMAVLFLEDRDGGQDRLPGRDLEDMLPQGVVHLALLSACHSADGQGRLAQALVLNGLPSAIGLAGPFPDPLSDELAQTLYEYLLEGYSLAEALRQARQALFEQDYQTVGLPVG